MNKAELVDAIQDNLNGDITKKNIGAVVDSLIETIQNQVAKGEKITLVGFGSFEKRDRQARKGHNPKTGEEMEIPATSVPAFSAGKTFKELVNF